MNNVTPIDSLRILKACQTERRKRERSYAFKILGMTWALIFCFAFTARATHQRAAEITYTWLGGNAYEFTLTTYNVPNAAWEQRDSLFMRWGDGGEEYIPRIHYESIGTDFVLNIYKAVHNYASSGTYTISMEDANRNFGVVNVPNSVMVPMHIETELVINPFLGYNNSVQLLNPPVDKGCVGKLYLHNPSAYDPDGDSLSYRLVHCKGTDGMEIPGYTYPQASHSFDIDPVTGDLRWDAPVVQGEYNVAFMVEEWRHGVKIGSVVRDMQILISHCDNELPEILCDEQYCLVAGEQLGFLISASDPDGDNVTLTASGAPFEVAVSPAILNPESAFGLQPQMEFLWNIQYAHIRNTPYQVVIHAKDDASPVSLTNLKTVTINVMGPKVQNLSAEMHGHDAMLSWSAYPCSNAVALLVYRKAGCDGYEPDACETGIREGYQLIATLNGSAATTYTDLDLPPGMSYEYRVVAQFPDGALSIVSDAACVTLKDDSPLITHVTNDSTDLEAGQVVACWTQPKEIDEQYVAPFSYSLTRILDGETASVYEGADTTFLDANVNLAEASSLLYKVEMRDAHQQLMGTSVTASAVLLSINGNNNEASLSWTEAVPWLVDSSQVFKEDGNRFVQIASVAGLAYTDTDVESDETYRYYVRTFGHYTLEGIMRPLVNYSAIKTVRIGHEEPVEEFSYTLPNVITPNGDGFNDVFEPKVTGLSLITGAKTVIFNRWGNILWDTDDPLIQWDGKSKQTNMDCPPGTYFYITDITYLDTTGEEKLHLQGSITIVR
ncbi:MAG: gliding motility-associated C-terminal domain-containing protein [Bacteroidales bacterium]|nr:gliding motility-associated C-terminal domain-containing protein [Bacteroidales bacterium]